MYSGLTPAGAGVAVGVEISAAGVVKAGEAGAVGVALIIVAQATRFIPSAVKAKRMQMGEIRFIRLLLRRPGFYQRGNIRRNKNGGGAILRHFAFSSYNGGRLAAVLRFDFRQ